MFGLIAIASTLDRYKTHFGVSKMAFFTNARTSVLCSSSIYQLGLILLNPPNFFSLHRGNRQICLKDIGGFRRGGD